MPSTFNGIGTIYHGNKNAVRYPGFCAHCGADVEMHEYDTTLYFAFIFAPIIPLKKQHVVDDCTECRRHRAMPAAEWDKLKEEALRKQMAAVSADPNDLRAAIQLLGMLGTFSRRQDAQAMADVVESRFPNQPLVRYRLGLWYRSVGESARADVHFRRALELDPSHRGTKRAVVEGYVREGNVEAACRLLTTPPILAPQDAPEVHVTLAQELQRRNQHQQALAVLGDLLDAAPSYGRNSAFRKQVRRSERQNPGGPSLLPHVPWFERKAIWIPAALLLAVSFFLAAQYHTFHHRKLYVVNGYDRPVELRLETGEHISVPAGEFRTLSLGEGPHRATSVIAGREDRVTDFAIESNWLRRLGDEPTYLLNVDGAAVVVWEQSVYQGDLKDDDKDLKSEVHVGKPFIEFKKVDYRFEPFPKQLEIKGKRKVVSRVGLIQGAPSAVFGAAAEGVTTEDRLAFAEAHLRINDRYVDLLEKYVSYAVDKNQSERCLRFIAEGLDRRPINIHRHRVYQDLPRPSAGDAELVAEYRKRLADEPESSASLQLLRRIEPDSATAAELFNRSIVAAPQNSFSHYDVSVGLRNGGEFENAKKAGAEACRLDPNNAEFEESQYMNRLGAGEAAALEPELERHWHEASTFEEAPNRLFEVLAIQGKQSRMREVFDAYRRRVAATTSTVDKTQAIVLAEIGLNSYTGDYRKILELSGSLKDPEEQASALFLAHASLGNFDEAAAHMRKIPRRHQGDARLALGVALRRAGDAKAADEFLRSAIEAFAEGYREERNFAAILRSIPDVSIADMESVGVVKPQQLALLLTALGQQCPEDRMKFLDLAEKLNFRPRPYGRLIGDAVREARKPVK